MPKLPNQKLRILYLLDILLEHTDEDRGLTLAEISAELLKHDIRAERKTLYDDINALTLYGVDLQIKRDRYVRYYIGKRDMTHADVKIISDALAHCGLIPESKLTELVKKISNRSRTYSFFDIRSGKEAYDTGKRDTLGENTDLLCRAILNDRQVSFRAFEWNSHKQRIMKNGGDHYTVSPWELKFADEVYTLTAYDSSEESFISFDISKIIDLSLTDKKREGGKAFFELKEMNNGLSANIRVRCDNSLAGEVFRRFGLNVTVLANREEYFEFSARTPIDNSLYDWLFKCGDKAEILSPDHARDEYLRRIELCLKKYTDR